MVFCVLTIVVSETVALGRTSIFRLRTLLPYLVSSITAALQGTALAIVFQSFFVAATKAPTRGAPVTTSYNLTMQCADGLFLTAVNGSLGCFANSSSVPKAVFGAKSMVAAAAVGSNLGQLSLMDQVTAIANLVVTANIFGSLVDGSLLSIVFFSFPLGYVVAHSTDGSEDSNIILSLLRQLRNVFLRLLYGLLKVTPIAVGFLIAAAVAKFDFQGETNAGPFKCAGVPNGISMGTAPVPNGGVVYLMTLWTTCFPSVPLPPSFAVVLAADFIRDRISTVVNVNGNAMVTRILADEIDATFEVQFL
ncbi:unnamed protein product [Aphanomyces euteiches]